MKFLELQCGDRMSETTKNTIHTTLTGCLEDANEQLRLAAATCLGCFARFAPEIVPAIVENVLQPGTGPAAHARMFTLSCMSIFNLNIWPQSLTLMRTHEGLSLSLYFF